MQHVAGDRAVDLAGEQLAQHVVVVVGRGADDVDLAGVVGRVAALGPLQPLVLLDQVPPQLVQVLLGVLVQRLLEAQHHLAPAREDQQLVAPHAGAGGVEGRRRRARRRPSPRSQSPLLAEPLEHHRHALGAQDVGVGPQHVGHARRDVLAGVDRVAQLVQHRAHPVLVGHDVGQHADVALAVDVGAEGVRALARLLVQVAALRARRRSAGRCRRRTRGTASGCRRLANTASRFAPKTAGDFLEERVVVVPGPQLVDGDAAVRGQLGVDLGLGRLERPAGQLVELVEQLEHLVLVLLVEVRAA